MSNRQVARCGVCIALLAVSAWITVPLGPVPFTMQTFVLALLPQVMRTRDAFFTVAVYLLLGTVGVPVFSGFDGAQAVTDFYNALLTEMDAYARETVYETAQARHCVASVLGSYSLDGVRDNQLRVTYTVTADYAEGEDATSTRTDAFDMTTGEHLLLE